MTEPRETWIDLEFPRVGRIRRRLPSDDPWGRARAEAALLYLFDHGAIHRLRKIQQAGPRMIWPGDITEGFNLDQIVRCGEYAPDRSYFERVYVVRRDDTNQVKIGMTGNVRARIETLSGAAGAHLRLLVVLKGGRTLEKELHERFAELRQFGEWFRYEGELVDWVEGRSLCLKS